MLGHGRLVLVWLEMMNHLKMINFRTMTPVKLMRETKDNYQGEYRSHFRSNLEYLGNNVSCQIG